jgi:hypothetical protein
MKLAGWIAKSCTTVTAAQSAVSTGERRTFWAADGPLGDDASFGRIVDFLATTRRESSGHEDDEYEWTAHGSNVSGGGDLEHCKHSPWPVVSEDREGCEIVVEVQNGITTRRAEATSSGSAEDAVGAATL